MEITITGRKMPITDPIRAYAEEKIGNSMKVMDINPLTAEVVLQVAGRILAAEVKRFPVFSFDEGELSGLPEPGAVEGELRLRGTVERGVEFEVVFLRAAGNNGTECEQDTDESGFHGNHRRVSNSCGKRPGRSQARSTGPSG